LVRLAGLSEGAGFERASAVEGLRGADGCAEAKQSEENARLVFGDIEDGDLFV